MTNDSPGSMVDIHCHLVPGIDDGSGDLRESLRMARMAVNDGIGTIIVTPHQLGNFRHNTGEAIRSATKQLQRELDLADIPLRVLPGADVRIEEAMTKKVMAGEVVSLGDHKRHLLLELPHELYFPLKPILNKLSAARMVGILSHPERNQGLLSQRKLLAGLVDHGCLMQLTAGSITGSMGTACQAMSRWMLREGLVHFVATDAHGIKSRRPLLRRAYNEVARLTDEQTAHDLCVANPGSVAQGEKVRQGRRSVRRASGWFGWRKAS